MCEYGFTKAEKLAEWNAQGGCAICSSARYEDSVVDHDHYFGKSWDDILTLEAKKIATRGLLCNDCNLGLGGLEKYRKGDFSRFISAAMYVLNWQNAKHANRTAFALEAAMAAPAPPDGADEIQQAIDLLTELKSKLK